MVLRSRPKTCDLTPAHVLSAHAHTHIHTLSHTHPLVILITDHLLSTHTPHPLFHTPTHCSSAVHTYTHTHTHLVSAFTLARPLRVYTLAHARTHARAHTHTWHPRSRTNALSHSLTHKHKYTHGTHARALLPHGYARTRALPLSRTQQHTLLYPQRCARGSRAHSLARARPPTNAHSSAPTRARMGTQSTVCPLCPPTRAHAHGAAAPVGLRR